MTELFHDHAQRLELHREIHARPPIPLRPPCLLSHLALLNDEDGYHADYMHLVQLLEHWGLPVPTEGTRQHTVQHRAMQLVWERHSEFTTVGLARPLPTTRPLQMEEALQQLLPGWLVAHPGQVIAGLHVVYLGAECGPEHIEPWCAELFAGNRRFGAEVDRTRVWTDFQLHTARMGRMLLHGSGGCPADLAGRLVKNLLEISTYQMLALLALPLVRSRMSAIAALERRLEQLGARLEGRGDAGEDHDMLGELTGVSASAERLRSELRYRIAASRAYHTIVQHRLESLQDKALPGLAHLSVFITHRLNPAMATIRAVERRLASLSADITRALALVRTRVDLVLEEQNQSILKSMERRVRQQLLLNQAVEGFSIVAISYYASALVGLLMAGMGELGWIANPNLVTACMVPIIVPGVWLLVRTARRRIEMLKHGSAA